LSGRVVGRFVGPTAARHDNLRGHIGTLAHDVEAEDRIAHVVARTDPLRSTELRAGASSAKRELERVRGEIQKVIEAIKAGFPPADLKEEMETLQERKEALLAQLAAATELPPLLHPNLADLWRAEIAELRDALTEDRCDLGGREAVRKMVEEIRLTPQDGTLAVEVKGNLAAMLATANPTTEDWERQLTLVAGGGFEPPTFGL
jgi:site-specific DNA recombinase